MVEMFRITTLRNLVEHVESRSALARKLLTLESQTIASKDVWHHSRGFSTLVERMFRSRKGLPEKVSVPPYGTTVEKFVDGEWVPITYQFVPAHLVLDGEVYDD